MTYLYEVTYKKNGEQTYVTVRAANKLEAIQEIAKVYGDITPVSVSRIGN